MPLGFERLNERSQRPNALINFIRPLPGRLEAQSKEFLERIAAIVYPIMKANHISVMALAEHEPNREFLGRNWNAGELIELVLRTRSGAWMPFRQVQRVMMHELAHCKQMNHSRYFWQQNAVFVADLQALWSKGYTGEGIWGRGRSLDIGAHITEHMPDSAEMPEHLCGGVYRNSRKRKRGRKENEKLTYAERQERRVLKKFGAGGSSLGSDENTMEQLEQGKKKSKGKPRIAKSARGRDLRAAAALARFEKLKQEDESKSLDGSETESDESPTEDEASFAMLPGSDGRRMVRVCGDVTEDDENARNEMKEIMGLYKSTAGLVLKPPEVLGTARKGGLDPRPGKEARKSSSGADSKPIIIDDDDDLMNNPAASDETVTSKPSFRSPQSNGSATFDTNLTPKLPPAPTKSSNCVVCSYTNELDTTLCAVCSNVLDPATMRNHWRCQSEACKGGVFVNAGDYGRCQVCGAAKVEA